MEVKIAKLQPTLKNFLTLRDIMDKALKEILQEILVTEWHIFKDLKGMEIVTDKRFKNLFKIKKYSPIKLKYAISPLLKQDLLESHVLVYVAIDKSNGANTPIGFSVWASNEQLEEYDILAFIYVFSEYRRKHIAKQLVDCNKTKVILVDEPDFKSGKMLETYYADKTVYGRKDGYEWVPLNEQEQETLTKLTGKSYESITSSFDNFESPKL